MKKVKIIFWIPITKLKYYIQVGTNIVTVTVVILGQIVWEYFCKLFPERGRMDWILLYNGGMCFRLSNWKVWQRLWSQGHKAFIQNKSEHEFRILLVQKCLFLTDFRIFSWGTWNSSFWLCLQWQEGLLFGSLWCVSALFHFPQVTSIHLQRTRFLEKYWDQKCLIFLASN